MRTRLIVSLFVVLYGLPVWASEPGQPLDCSDFVLVAPGLTCTYYLCDDSAGRPAGCAVGGDGGATPLVDNDGRFVVVESYVIGDLACGSVPFHNVQRFEIVAYQGLQRNVLAYLDERCGVGDATDEISGVGGHEFDRVNGHYFWVTYATPYVPYPPSPYPATRRIFLFEGFTTLFDILQTFAPQTTLGFHVPYMPEGMPAADYFDTYWGDLATVGNWGQAHGLQCHYPTAGPARGDYLTVADTLPTPQPGHGYYYVTASSFQGQARYGRKTTGGRLTGRDPALLPACTTEGQR